MATGDPFGFGTNLLGVTTRPSGESRVLTTQDTWAANCSSASAEDGTEISAEWLDEVAGNLRALARGNGTLADGTTKIAVEDHSDGMLLAAVQQMIQRRRTNYCVDSGAANAMVASVAPAPAEMIDGFEVNVKAAHAPTGATTFALNGETPRAVLRKGGAALAGGEWADGDIIALRRNGNTWRLTGLVPADISIPTVSTIGRLLNVQAFGASTTYYPTAGTTKALVFITGGGGAGGGANGAYSVGYGGGAGATAFGLFNIGAPGPITIGAGGAGYAGGGGGNGGDSSFGNGALWAGGGYGALPSGEYTAGSGGFAGGSNGQLFANLWPGGAGSLSTTGSSGNFIVGGGVGGASFWGGGGLAGNSQNGGQAGATGAAPGSGGGGADSGGAGPIQGGAGAGGYCLILEFS